MAPKERRLYVGNLPYDIREKDIEDMFHKFGKLVDLKLKIPRGGNPFCFLEFESAKDAEDALRRRNNYVIAGSKIRVEYPTGNGPRGRGGRPIGGSGGGRRGGAAFSRSEFRVRVTGGSIKSSAHSPILFKLGGTGLPPSGSWQDLKDHMREGEVCYANVSKDGTGIVEYVRYDDMKYAIKKLDDSRFRSHEGEVAYIRVKRDEESRSRSRSRSRSFSPRRSRASPDYGGGKRSPKSSRSRSRSRESRH